MQTGYISIIQHGVFVVFDKEHRVVIIFEHEPQAIEYCNGTDYTFRFVSYGMPLSMMN